MAGVKGRSGRRPEYRHQLDSALLEIDRNLPELFKILVSKALAGDKDCLVYVIDRRMGRPRQEIDARVRSIIQFNADDYELMGRTQVPQVSVETPPALPLGVVDNNQ